MRTAVTATVTVCVQCGHRLDEGAVRCASCGHVVDRAGLSAATARRRHAVMIEADGTAPVLPAAVAPIGRRLVALLLDQVLGGLVVVLAVVGWLLAGLPTGRPLLWAVVGLSAGILVAQLVAEAVTGATVGAAMVGIRTVHARTGLPAGLVAVLVRDLVLAAGSLVLGVGAYVVAGSGAWDTSPTRRGWHDRAAGTMVLLAAAVSPRGDRASSSSSNGAGTDEPRRTSASARLTEPRRSVSSSRAAVRVAPPDLSPMRDVPADAVPGLVPGPTGVPGSGGVPGPVDAPTAVVAPAPIDAPALIDAPVPISDPGLAPGPAPVPGAPSAAAGEGAGTSSGAPDLLPDAPGPATQVLAGAQDGPAPLGAGHPVTDAAAARMPDEVELTRFAHERPVELLAEPWLRLVADTGEVVDVVGDGAIGRDPSHSSGRGAYHQVVLADPERSMSRLHLLFGPEQGGGLLWVSDPGSTNGTVLQDPTGATAVLAPGVRAVIGAGWVLRLGDRTVTVVALV